jgi:hypothetical protein
VERREIWLHATEHEVARWTAVWISSRGIDAVVQGGGSLGRSSCCIDVAVSRFLCAFWSEVLRCSVDVLQLL